MKAWLLSHLARLRATSPAFADSSQAEAVINLTFEDSLAAYRRHHADLLFHLAPADFEHPFLLVRMVEAILEHGSPWIERERSLRIDRTREPRRRSSSWWSGPPGSIMVVPSLTRTSRDPVRQTASSTLLTDYQ